MTTVTVSRRQAQRSGWVGASEDVQVMVVQSKVDGLDSLRHRLLYAVTCLPSFGESSDFSQSTQLTLHEGSL